MPIAPTSLLAGSARVPLAARAPWRWLSPEEPVPGAAETEARAPATRAEVAGEIRLLIVDDDPLMTEFLPRRLARAMLTNVRILTATTAAGADAIIEREQPHVILSDYDLRDVRTGIEVLRSAARLAPRSARILFSGHSRREIGASLEAAGVDAYIEKPMRLDDLIPQLLASIRATTGMDLSR